MSDQGQTSEAPEAPDVNALAMLAESETYEDFEHKVASRLAIHA